MNAQTAIAILDSINALITLVISHASRARERGEWTPEEEDAFDRKVAQVTSAQHWQP